MKAVSFFIFLVLSSFLTFSQSARKANKRLCKEYELVDDKQDSLEKLMDKEWAVKEQQLLDFLAESQHMYRIEEKYLDLRTAVRNQLLTLELLNRSSLSADEKQLMDSSLFRSSVASAVRNVSVMSVFLVPLHDLGINKKNPLRVQNQLLADLIRVKTAEVNRLTVDLQRVKDIRRGMAKEKNDYLELTVFCEKMTPLLETLHSKSDSILKEEKKRFIEKGPADFPDSYHSVFPDAFERTKSSYQIYSVENLDTILKQEDSLNKRASFPGGSEQFEWYLARNLRYPQIANELMLEGKCYVELVVSASGEVSDFRVLRGVPECMECDKEAIRLAGKMGNWKPAWINGKPVNSRICIPITFRLNQYVK